MKKLISNLSGRLNRAFGKSSSAEDGKRIEGGVLAVNIVSSSYSGRPSLVIDSAADDTLADILRIGGEHHSNLVERLRVFNFGDPQSSYRYHPLMHGDADQIFRKVLCALDLDIKGRVFFGVNRALRAVVDAVVYLDRQRSFGYIAKILRDPLELENLDRELTARVAAGTDGARLVQLTLRSISSSLSERDFVSVATELEDFEAEVDAKMNSGAPALDVSTGIPDRQIFYFQLNLDRTRSVGRRLGRMLLEDLNDEMDSRHKTHPEDRRQCSVFVRDAIEFSGPALLNIVRGSRASGLALRLYTPNGLEADLRHDGFVRGILNNTVKAPSSKICGAQSVFDAAGVPDLAYL